ncbi:DUF2243 domain-containing protein [Planococcus maritimus]|uniref:DUF2243 domain-containing protein n=1 Tax=Planococcus maritimus TaxID=192421 RepID=A0A7D7MAU7_PLAMR|nr:DUF2243 domain-containing protein [Planococcus maritimus]KYG59758.1 hypothetical protein AY633_05840 [Planococcus maritimus]OED33458.1 hypothetical protein BHE17_13730 [Planococcus maritimus]QMT17095.1 DUF2243 domain-containing protein [Planococcus maritimus]
MVSGERKIDLTKARNRRVHSSRNFWAGLLFGAGMFSVLEQSIFHFFLQWHHFYEGNGPQAIWTGEGIYQLVGWALTVLSMGVAADLARRKSFWPARFLGSAVIGGGVLLAVDSLVFRLLLNLHAVRTTGDPVFYESLWLGTAVFLVLLGWSILRNASKEGD